MTREKRRFSAWTDDSEDITIIEYVKLIDTGKNPRDPHSPRVIVEGSKRHFITEDGRDAECTSDGVYEIRWHSPTLVGLQRLVVRERPSTQS